MSTFTSTKIPRRHRTSPSCPVIAYGHSPSPTLTSLTGNTTASTADEIFNEHCLVNLTTSTSIPLLTSKAIPAMQITHNAGTESSASHTVDAHLMPYKLQARAANHARSQSSFLPRPSPRFMLRFTMVSLSEVSFGQTVYTDKHSRSTSKSFIPRATAHQSRWSTDLEKLSNRSASSSSIHASTRADIGVRNHDGEAAASPVLANSDNDELRGVQIAAVLSLHLAHVSPINLCSTDTNRHDEDHDEAASTFQADDSTPPTSPITPSPSACRLRPFRLSAAATCSSSVHLVDGDSPTTSGRRFRLIRPRDFVVRTLDDHSQALKERSTPLREAPGTSSTTAACTTAWSSSSSPVSPIAVLASSPPMVSPAFHSTMSTRPFSTFLPSSASCLHQWHDMITRDLRYLELAEIELLLKAGQEWLGTATEASHAMELTLYEDEMF